MVIPPVGEPSTHGISAIAREEIKVVVGDAVHFVAQVSGGVVEVLFRVRTDTNGSFYHPSGFCSRSAASARDAERVTGGYPQSSNCARLAW